MQTITLDLWGHSELEYFLESRQVQHYKKEEVGVDNVRSLV